MNRLWIAAVCGLLLVSGRVPAQGRPGADTGPAGPTTHADLPADGGAPDSLFTVRIAWDPADVGQTASMEALVGVLGEVGLPVWPVEPVAQPADSSVRDRPGDHRATAHRRLGAFRSTAAARVLGHHIETDYALTWEPVRLAADADVTDEQIEASHAYLESLEEAPEGAPEGAVEGGGSGGGT